MFGRGNDVTNMPKNLCAMYYVCPTTDITKGEIRIGVESEASTSSTNCITFDTSTKVTTLPNNLIVNGSITDNGSKTITHYTKYEGDIKPGCFVESTGKIYRNEESTLSPYEDCISIVKQATEYNNNIIGVCTEIIDEEFCKYATHGDVLIKCVSDTYKLGDILIPTTGGYSKKANNMEIIDEMTHLIPRLKVTSVETEIIDSETVCAFISL